MPGFRKVQAGILALVSCAGMAQERPIAFTGARLIPISGPEIARGTLVVQGGKIVAAGPAAGVRIPENADQRDVSGKVIMAGFVDTHSHIGGVDGGDSSAALHPDVRAIDSINVRDTRFRKAQAGGITTVNIMPGSGLLLSGQTLYLKLRNGGAIDDFLIPWPDGTPMGGMKMANGTNSRGNPPRPGTRAKSAALARELFIKAREYGEKVRAAGSDRSKLPPRDLKLEGLSEVLDGKRVVHFHTHRHDDILTVIRLSKEFGFKLVLQHVSDAWAVAGEIAASKAPCSIIVLDSPGGKIEAKDIRFGNGAALERAGAVTGFHTDDPVTDSRHFRRSAALAVRAGMSREKALYGLTMAGAIMLELQNRIGSLEAGKDADFVVLSGDPLSVYTQVLETWVEGSKVFDRADPKDRLLQVGGWGAGAGDSSLHLHEEEDER
jgi:imidazolonepropionase-like amidohydrolase